MGGFMIYSLKMAIYLAVLYTFYKRYLSKETCYRFNRLTLLGCIAASALLPLMHLPDFGASTIKRGMASVEHLIQSGTVVGTASVSQALSFVQWMMLLYVAGVVIMSLMQLVSLLQLWLLIRRGERVNDESGAELVVMDDDIAPFSWFGYIVISRDDLTNYSQDIIIHEMAHVSHHHSFDVVLCNLLVIMQWYNPLAWMLKKDMQNLHEFEADADVLQSGVDARQYQMLLIRKSAGEKMFAMANNLNHNSLKKRITMMNKKKSNPWVRMRILPLACLAFVTMAFIASPKAETITDKVVTESGQLSAAAITKASKPKDNIMQECEVMPQYVGGPEAMFKFLSENIKYPKAAEQRHAQGRALVSFVVRTDGTLSDIKIIRHLDPDLDAEAIRLIKSMPKWIPGYQKGKAVNVKYVLPITFKLQ